MNGVVDMHRCTDTLRHILPLGIFVLVAVLVLADGTTASAAAHFSSDIGLKGGDNAFQNNLTIITNGMFAVARIISTIMIALAGIMIAFNVETANKTTWNIILGIGLALNFGTALMSAFGGSFGGADQAPFEYRMHVTADEDSKWYDFLQPFTRTYIDYTKSGAVSIMPVAAKLLIVLTAISASVKISLDLISGDKMKFLVQTLLETGLYLFLILNWYGHGIDIMGSLCSGFQAIGYHAGGYSDGMGSGSLIANAVTMFTTGYGAAQEAFSIWSPISGLFTILCLVIMFILLVLAGIEMLMAKIEFFTMAMITIPLIPFVALPQTKFLFERALGAMFNLAIKVAVISFLTAMSSRILTDYCEEFATIATDEGISDTNTKKRDGFNQMIEDALAGKIDLIITKSVSRFARNTVDSLQSVRKLKEHGVEIYFEKENIWTFDTRGELLITIMSSLAQEESRSISENTTWGKRKQFAEGKTSVGYSAFLGYDKDFKINEEQAKVVKLIYKLFLGGRSFYAITKELEKRGIKSPSGKDKWYISTVRSILTNEKYRGDALIQKEYTADFLDKTRRKNMGEISQYYVEEHHEAIIPPDLFDFVQTEIKEREKRGKHSSVSIFANKIKWAAAAVTTVRRYGTRPTSTAGLSTAATRNMPTRESRAAQGI